MKNQKISTLHGTIILAIIAITAGVIVWQVVKNQEVLEQPQVIVNVKKPTGTQSLITEQQMTNWKTYQNKNLGLAFNYPSDWGDVVFENGNSNSVNIPPCKAPFMMNYMQKQYPWGLYNAVLKFSKAPIDLEIRLINLDITNNTKKVCNIKGEIVTISTIQPKIQNNDVSITNKSGVTFISDPILLNSINTSLEGPTYSTRYSNKLIWIYSGFTPRYNSPEGIELQKYTSCKGADAYNTKKGCGIIAWYQIGKTAAKIHIAFDNLKEIIQSFTISK